MNDQREGFRTRYHLLREIISSNYSTIYLAEDTAADPKAAHRQVIIKRLHWDKFPGEKFKLYDEIRFQRLMQGHPYIGQILDSWEEDRDIILVLEHATCGDLHHFMWRHRDQMTIERIQKILFQVLSGLNDLHKRGIMHRDIKPENVLLDRFQDAKLIDFGWSSEIGNLLTNTEGAGTLTYMSPECLLKAPQNCATDIWSFGVLAYELYHYKEAFPAKDQEQAIEQVTKTSPKIDASRCPPEARSLIESCLRYKAYERPKANQLLKHPLFASMPLVGQKGYGICKEEPWIKQVVHLEQTPTESCTSLQFSLISERITSESSDSRSKSQNQRLPEQVSGRRAKYTPISAIRPLHRPTRGDQFLQNEAVAQNKTAGSISHLNNPTSASQQLLDNPLHKATATKPRLELRRRLDGTPTGGRLTEGPSPNLRNVATRDSLSASAVNLHVPQTPTLDD